MCQGRFRKQFSPLWSSCEGRGSLFMCRKDLIMPFFPPRRCYVQACLSAWEDQDSSFHRSGGSVWVVLSSLCVGNPDKAVSTSTEMLCRTWRSV